MECASRSRDVSAITETGGFCSRSGRRRAVTTISPSFSSADCVSAPADGGIDAAVCACSAAGAIDAAAKETKARARVSIRQRTGPLTRIPLFPRAPSWRSNLQTNEFGALPRVVLLQRAPDALE